MRRLDRYVLVSFIGPFAMLAGLIVALFIIIDLFGRFDEFLKLEDMSVAKAIFMYYLYVLPGILSEWLLPIIAVISSLFAVSSLDRHQEIIAMMASGISRQRLLLPILASTLLISCGDYLLKSRVVPGVAPLLEELNARMGGDKEGGDIVKNVALNNRTSDGFQFWYATRVHRNEQKLEGLYLTRMSLKGEWMYRLSADSAVRAEGKWLLNNVEIQKVGEQEVPVHHKYMEIATPLTVEDLLLHDKKPQFLSDADLRRMKSSKRLHVELISRPVTSISSFLLALWGMIILFFSRNGSFFIAVSRCVLMVIGYYAFVWLLLQGATYTRSPPVVVLYMPIMGLLAAGLYYYRKMPS